MFRNILEMFICYFMMYVIRIGGVSISIYSMFRMLVFLYKIIKFCNDNMGGNLK